MRKCNSSPVGASKNVTDLVGKRNLIRMISQTNNQYVNLSGNLTKIQLFKSLFRMGFTTAQIRSEFV